MAVAIRLKRMGAKREAFYRIVVMDTKSPRDGKSIEQIGYYNPMKEKIDVKIDKEKAEHWLSVGAQPSQTVRSLLKKEGIAVK